MVFLDTENNRLLSWLARSSDLSLKEKVWSIVANSLPYASHYCKWTLTSYSSCMISCTYTCSRVSEELSVQAYNNFCCLPEVIVLGIDFSGSIFPSALKTYQPENQSLFFFLLHSIWKKKHWNNREVFRLSIFSVHTHFGMNAISLFLQNVCLSVGPSVWLNFCDHAREKNQWVELLKNACSVALAD